MVIFCPKCSGENINVRPTVQSPQTKKRKLLINSNLRFDIAPLLGLEPNINETKLIVIISYISNKKHNFVL